MKVKNIKLILALEGVGNIRGSAEKEMERALMLVRLIKERIKDVEGVVQLFTSPARMTTRTAKVIGDELSIKFEPVDSLLFGDYETGRVQLSKILRLMKDDCAVIIAISHNEAPAGILNAFSEKYLKRSIPCGEISTDSVLCLCADTGELSSLRV